jgi:hypothetical protein
LAIFVRQFFVHQFSFTDFRSLADPAAPSADHRSFAVTQATAV